MATTRHGQRQVLLTFLVSREADPETGQFEAYCEELGTASCGDSVADALRMIREACSLELETVSEFGELEQYLDRHHVAVSAGEQVSPEDERGPIRSGFLTTCEFIPLPRN